MHIIKLKIGREQGDVSEQLNVMMVQMLIQKIEVVEAYSPPRVAEMARKMGFKAGWSLDLTTIHQDGRMLEFNEIEMRNRAGAPN